MYAKLTCLIEQQFTLKKTRKIKLIFEVKDVRSKTISANYMALTITVEIFDRQF